MRALLFDLGNVLVDVGFEQAITNVLQYGRASRADVEQFLFASETSYALEEGRISGREYWDALRRELGFTGDYATFLRLWNGWIGQASETSTLFAALTTRYPVGIISNTNTLHLRHLLDTCALFRQMTGPIVASCWVGARKPQPRIYEIAIDRLGASPSDILYIDDHPDWVEAGRRHGLRAVHYQGHASLLVALQDAGITWTNQPHPSATLTARS